MSLYGLVITYHLPGFREAHHGTLSHYVIPHKTVESKAIVFKVLILHKMN